MSKVSDQERRKVAVRLRENDDWKNSIRALWDALDARTEVVESNLYYDYLKHNGKILFNRLADLIDRPAVKPVYPYDDMPDYLFCGECNTQIWNSANYCPQCGTRCVPYGKPFFDNEDRRIHEAICCDV